MPEYKPTKSELSSFCNGMYSMYEFSRGTGPDVAIFPLRGAHPFSVAYRKIAELNKESTPDFLLLPLGTFTDIHTKTERGLTKPEKIEVVQNGLQNYFAEHLEAKRILLIDEVMNGGTILTHHSLLNRYLQENIPEAVLRVCAIEHGQHEQRRRYKNQAVKNNFHTVRVDSLFVMDREQYLPKVRRNSIFSVEVEDGKLEEILEEIERMH
jgi:hypoxanthine phosphoribosyltransferase